MAVCRHHRTEVRVLTAADAQGEMVATSDEPAIANSDAVNEANASSQRIMLQVRQALEAEGVNFWLDAGSCLKAVRDGQFLRASDVDIGMWRSQTTAILRAVERLRQQGFRVRFQNGLPYVDDLILLMPPDDAPRSFMGIDLMLYRAIGDEAAKPNSGTPVHSQFLVGPVMTLLRRLTVETYSDRNLLTRLANLVPLQVRKAAWRCLFELYSRAYQTIWFVVPRHHFGTLGNVEVDGIAWPVPSKVTDYLEYRYGHGWTKPDRNWRLCDGDLIRFRRLSSLPKDQWQFIWVQSDVVHGKRFAPRGTFRFTAEEQRKIRQRA